MESQLNRRQKVEGGKNRKKSDSVMQFRPRKGRGVGKHQASLPPKIANPETSQFKNNVAGESKEMTHKS